MTIVNRKKINDTVQYQQHRGLFSCTVLFGLFRIKGYTVVLLLLFQCVSIDIVTIACQASNGYYALFSSADRRYHKSCYLLVCCRSDGRCNSGTWS